MDRGVGERDIDSGTTATSVTHSSHKLPIQLCLVLVGQAHSPWAPSEVLSIMAGWGQLRLCKRWWIFGGIPIWFLGLAFPTCCHCHCCLQLLHILFHKRRYFQEDNWDCSCHGGDLYKIDDRTLSKQGFEEMLCSPIEACVWLNGLSPAATNIFKCWSRAGALKGVVDVNVWVLDGPCQCQCLGVWGVMSMFICLACA